VTTLQGYYENSMTKATTGSPRKIPTSYPNNFCVFPNVLTCLGIVTTNYTQSHRQVDHEFRDSTKAVSRFLDIYTSRHNSSKFSSETNLPSISSIPRQENPTSRRGPMRGALAREARAHDQRGTA
jgi:hypothetical protein